MNKREVQERVTQNGKKLALSKFSWDEKTKTFSSSEDNLVIDFKDQNYCAFTTGSDCAFKAGSCCAFKTDVNCTFKTDVNCIFKTGANCTFKTGSNCVFNTGSSCTFKTGYNCTFNTDSNCIFNTGSSCTFNTSYGCVFKTGYDCTFDTGSNCTFDTGFNCTFKTGYDCVITNRNSFEVIVPNKGDIIQICPYNIEGHLKNGIYSETGKKSVIVDGILSEIKTERTTKDLTIYKVINHGESELAYLIKRDDLCSHGATLKEAVESLKYKISDRDTSKYNTYTLKTVLTEVDAIEMYRVITGACEGGTRYFVENLKNKPKKLTVEELIELTKNQYNNNKLVKFFKKRKIRNE